MPCGERTVDMPHRSACCGKSPELFQRAWTCERYGLSAGQGSGPASLRRPHGWGEPFYIPAAPDGTAETLPPVRQGLDMEIVGSAVNGKQALELYEKERPDILLTDIRMPVMDGLELIAHIRERDKAIRIVVLSCLEEFRYLQEAMRMEVSDYILKLKMKPAENGWGEPFYIPAAPDGTAETLPPVRQAPWVLCGFGTRSRASGGRRCIP